jgi:hypothetical protein
MSGTSVLSRVPRRVVSDHVTSISDEPTFCRHGCVHGGGGPVFAGRRGVVTLDGHRVILVEFRPKISMRRSHAMAAGSSIDMSGWLEEQLGQASPDLPRSMVQRFAEALMGAEADAVCGALMWQIRATTAVTSRRCTTARTRHRRVGQL